jgi:uracil-DNA glycosylase family 4
MMDCPIFGAEGFGQLEGTGVNGVLILGEALGEQELRDGGLPFRPWAPAGSVLERALRLNGGRESFALWNAVPTHPPKNYLEGAPYEAAALAWGRAHLDRIVAQLSPRCILSLGNIATKLATGLSGDGYNIGLLEGYVLEGIYPSIPVIPSFHPSFLRRGAMSHFGCLLRDIGLAKAVAREGRQPTKAPHESPPAGYNTHPTETEAWNFYNKILYDGNPTVAYDIETPYSKKATEESAEEDQSSTSILSIQFSLAPGSGIFLPWRQPFIEIARRILALPNGKLGWNNWRFDDPRLISNGLTLGGVVHDLMWAWHHLQPDLPRGLQFAAKFFGWPYPWKHLNFIAPEFYGIVDCDVLQTIVGPLSQSLKDAGIWRGYQKHILELEPILQKMSARGMPISVARFGEVEAELKRRVEHGVEDMQSLVPDEAKALKTFKTKPSVRLPWKPSNQAFQRYATFRGHELPTDWKTKKITFDAIHLKRLYAKTKDPLYKAVLDYRDAATVLSNHIENWKPAGDDRVHSTFYYDPATGQLSSRRPNIQNAPKHRDDGLFRSIVQASEGKVLIEFDYKSFHALTLGFEAQDRDYMRLARLDIHSFITAHLLKLGERDGLLGLCDAELSERLSAIRRDHKHVRDYKAKRAILGYGFGLGAKGLWERYKEDLSLKEARELFAMIDACFPKAKQWRSDIRVQAHEQKCLISRHGYIRRFYEVLKWEHGAGLVPGGEQSEAAIAFLPANDAFGTIKDAILALDARSLLERFGFINTVHDSLLFECDKTLAEECIATVWPVMEKPSVVLVDPLVAPDGLVCEVGVSVGPSWEKMEELKREAPALR